MISKLSPELLILVAVLFFIAAAFDLWLLRFWKRRREQNRRNQEGADFHPAPAAPSPEKDARRKTGKAPAASAAAPVASAPPPGAAKNPPPQPGPAHADPPPPAGKRGGKLVPQQASLSVRGKSGRTAHVNISMELPEGESVRLTLESVGQGVAFATEGKGRPAGSGTGGAAAPAWLRAGWSFGFRAASPFLADVRTTGRSLFALALIVYLLTRLIGLTRWPIYFFTDEAVQTNFAADLVDRNYHWAKEEPLPVFFENAGQYEMNFSVYVQLVPYLLFGKSVFVTRAVSVLITVLGAAALGGILRRAFRLPLWWSGVLLLSIVPVWFLHSRTAFEPGEAISFYALFLYFYMRYRDDKPWMLLPALFFGALSAYTYSPMQVTVAFTGVLLLVSDAVYHWRHRSVALAGCALLIVLAIPYIRFLQLHPEANRDQLAIVGSYWLNNISFTEMLKQFFTQYISGLDPRYWYLANPPESVRHDIVRHLMKGYGHLSLWSLPFAVLGILLSLTNLRRSHFRTLLIALLAAPAGGAVAQITITRTLVMVIPVSLLTALGINWLSALIERPEDPAPPDFLQTWRGRLSRWAAGWAALRDSQAVRVSFSGVRDFLRGWRDRTARIAAERPGFGRIPRVALALGLFLILGSVNGYMLWDSLTNGPTWYTNYQLYGMQYGGEQLCAALKAYHAEYPADTLIVTSSWANGADEIFKFFLDPDFPMAHKTVQEYIQTYVPIGEQDVFVMTSEEYSIAVSSGRFSSVSVLQTLYYPNGNPGFYFARLAYVENVQEIIAAEQAELAKPVTETLLLNGESIRVVHSRFDMGNLTDGFDLNPFSLIRTQQANPMVLDMYFPEPHRFIRIMVRVGGAPTQLTAALYPIGGGDPVIHTVAVDRSSDYRNLTIEPDVPVESDHVRLEIETVGEGEPTHVHVYEIELEGEGWKSGTANPSP